MRERIQVYAIIRIDQHDSIKDSVTVTAILPTMREADAEVARLNELNRDKGASYYWLATRYFTKGKGDGRTQMNADEHGSNP